MAKTFRGELNPAMNFISNAEACSEEGAGAARGAPKGYKPNPLYIETKSRRLQLLVTPTLYGLLKAEAERQGCSVNAAANAILEEGLKDATAGGEKDD